MKCFVLSLAQFSRGGPPKLPLNDRERHGTQALSRQNINHSFTAGSIQCLIELISFLLDTPQTFPQTICHSAQPLCASYASSCEPSSWPLREHPKAFTHIPALDVLISGDMLVLLIPLSPSEDRSPHTRHPPRSSAPLFVMLASNIPFSSHSSASPPLARSASSACLHTTNMLGLITSSMAGRRP